MSIFIYMFVEFGIDYNCMHLLKLIKNSCSIVPSQTAWQRLEFSCSLPNATDASYKSRRRQLRWAPQIQIGLYKCPLFLLPEAHSVFEMVLFVCLSPSMKDFLRYRDATWKQFHIEPILENLEENCWLFYFWHVDYWENLEQGFVTVCLNVLLVLCWTGSEFLCDGGSDFRLPEAATALLHDLPHRTPQRDHFAHPDPPNHPPTTQQSSNHPTTLPTLISAAHHLATVSFPNTLALESGLILRAPMGPESAQFDFEAVFLAEVAL